MIGKVQGLRYTTPDEERGAILLAKLKTVVKHDGISNRMLRAITKKAVVSHTNSINAILTYFQKR